MKSETRRATQLIAFLSHLSGDEEACFGWYGLGLFLSHLSGDEDV